MATLRSNRAIRYVMEHPRIMQGVVGGFAGMALSQGFTNQYDRNKWWKVGGAAAAGAGIGASLSPKAWDKVAPWLEGLG